MGSRLKVPLVLLALAAGCSSSSGLSHDARFTDDLAGQDSAKGDAAANPSSDVAVSRPDINPTSADGPASLNDVSASDSSGSSDRSIATPDGTADDSLTRDTNPTDTRTVADVNLAAVCTPGFDPSCNHFPESAVVAGSCQPDGTCVCNSGYAIHPTSGRCLALPIPIRDASSDADFVCPAPFDACGCGCCGTGPRYAACYYPTAGETLQSIKDKDVFDRTTTNCAAAGCSAGTRYVCCTPTTPETTSAATYSADGWMGDLDHLTIDKVGTQCARLQLSSPANTRAGFHIDSTTGWGLMAATFGACTDAAISTSVTGGLGTVDIRREGSGCVVDVHVTLFDVSTAGELQKTTRMDVDGLAIVGMGVCR
jgi:hypothetical protein